MIKQFSLWMLLGMLMVPNLMGQEERPWFQGGPWERPVPNPQAKILPLIRVEGKRLVDPDGKELLLRGLAISDPDKLERQGHWSRRYFEEAASLGAMVIRIPVHPVAWRERSPGLYLELLDQAVAWCTELGMYVMIDWHSIGNLEMELFQDPMYNTSKQETYRFWRTIASHFKGHNTVAFYEIFNEPTLYRGQLGNMTWAGWRKINEDVITVIRGYDGETIPLVAGLDWAYDLNPIRTDPVRAEGIAYVSHPYEHKREPPWEPKWEEAFGFAAEKYPVIATEFGFGVRPGHELHEDHYAYHIIDYLEGRGISWVCWVFDAEWGPRMLKSWEPRELTESGEFFKKALHGQLDIQND
jgi:endoglucanase